MRPPAAHAWATSRASRSVSGGRIPGRHLASSVLPAPGRTGQEEVVAAGRRHLQSPPGDGLAPHLAQIERARLIGYRQRAGAAPRALPAQPRQPPPANRPPGSRRLPPTRPLRRILRGAHREGPPRPPPSLRPGRHEPAGHRRRVPTPPAPRRPLPPAGPPPWQPTPRGQSGGHRPSRPWGRRPVPG